MHRFFISKTTPNERFFKIRGQDHHHICNVLRLRPEATVIMVDEMGNEYSGVITELTKDEVIIGDIVRLSDVEVNEPRVDVILAHGLPKGDKLDAVVRMCTEVGVREIIPMITQRTIPKLKPAQMEKRVARWQRIAGEAAKQCRRGKVPSVRGLLTFQEVLEEATLGAMALMPWESSEGEPNLREILSASIFTRVYVLIGPEGGFSLEEVELARTLGVVTMSLGKRILRTETAGVVSTSLILYELGELGGVSSKI